MSRFLEIRKTDWESGRSALTPSELTMAELEFVRYDTTPLLKKSGNVSLMRYRDTYESRRILEKVWRSA